MIPGICLVCPHEAHQPTEGGYQEGLVSGTAIETINWSDQPSHYGVCLRPHVGYALGSGAFEVRHEVGSYREMPLRVLLLSS